MSIRGSLQNIRDQIGKINTIIDGSKGREEPGTENVDPTTNDRGPVSHVGTSEPRHVTADELYGRTNGGGMAPAPGSGDPQQHPQQTDLGMLDQPMADQVVPEYYDDDAVGDEGLFSVAFPADADSDMAFPGGDLNHGDELVDESLLDPELDGFDPVNDLDFATIENFDSDAFGQEYSGGTMIDDAAIDPAAVTVDEMSSVVDESVVEDSPVSMVGPDGLRIADRVVDRLIRKGLVTEKQVRESYEEWTSLKEEGYSLSLWRVLTLHPELKREMIFEEAALVYAFERATISRSDAIAFIEKVVPVFEGDRLDRMLDLFVIPVAKEKDPRTGDTKWLFVTHDPTRPEAHKLLRELGIRRFELRYWSESVIEDVITAGVLTKNVYLDRLNDDPMVYDLGTNFDKDKADLVNEEELENEINRSSLINLFEASLVEAVNRGASDIHIFPNPKAQIEIHFRIDGHLELWHKEERISAESFLAVVKDKSNNVDRFEKDTAQDGFIQRPIGDTTIRFRVSILPIASHKPGAAAESIVIRVLDDRKVLSDLRKVGMLDQAMKKFKEAIHQPHGMVILTGPTGSGKSTTLVAALHQVINPKVNVLTIEDPVEYLIKGVRQVKLSHHLSMEGALRALLRHDPDVVMVGEMRDQETAELAIKLANTGHLTFSTLHTNDAPSAVSRLYKMGIEPFLIAYAINIIVAQRLIRSLCKECKVVDTKKPDLMAVLGFTPEEIESATIYKAGNNPDCPTCAGIGYKGRRAVAETLYFSDAVRAQIIKSGDVIDEQAIREIATSEGMLSLQASAREIAKEGDTSIEEVIRITGQ